jgi:ubiquinone/menaquinone biosynthesis C-methylase UbiE
MAKDRAPERVREVYDEIAGHFAKTRAYPWPETESFLADVQSGDVGLDVGCGNGRNAGLLATRTERVVALDVSRELLRLARERLADPSVAFVEGDAKRLPVATDSVDVGVYVATIHHLPDRRARQESLAELARVLVPGGQALVSAWSTAHDRFEIDENCDTGFDTTVDWALPGGETVPRFYHIYAPKEFEADLAASPLTVVNSFVASGNCYAEVTVTTRRTS